MFSEKHLEFCNPWKVHVCWIIPKSRLPTNDITLMTMAWQHSADKLGTFSLPGFFDLCTRSTGSPLLRVHHSSLLDNYTWKGVPGLVMKFHTPFYLTGPGQRTKTSFYLVVDGIAGVVGVDPFKDCWDLFFEAGFDDEETQATWWKTAMVQSGVYRELRCQISYLL